MQRDIWKFAPEQRCVAPVRGRLMAVEQPRFCKHQRTAAGCIELRPFVVHPHDPVEQPAIQRTQAVRGVDHDVGNEHHVGAADIGNRVLGDDADTGHEFQRTRLGADEARFEQRAPRRQTLANIPKLAGGPQGVEHPVDDGGIALGKDHETDVDGFLAHRWIFSAWLKWHGAGHSASHAQALPDLCAGRKRTPVPQKRVERIGAMNLDMSKLEPLLGTMVNELGAAANAALVFIGGKLGLFDALAERPVTSAELAAKTDTNERLVREWLASQAASGYITYDGKTGKFSLSPEQAAVLADEDSTVFMRGGFLSLAAVFADEAKLTTAFRTGRGVGWGRALQLPVLRCRALLPPGVQGQPHRRVAALTRRCRRKTAARSESGRRGLRARSIHNPDGGSVSQFRVRRHRLSRCIDRVRATEGQTSEECAVPSRTCAGLRRRRIRSGGHVRCSARHGRSRGGCPPCQGNVEAGWNVDARRANGGRHTGSKSQPGRPRLLCLLHRRLRPDVLEPGGRDGTWGAGRREAARLKCCAKADFHASAGPPRRRSTWFSKPDLEAGGRAGIHASLP